MKKLLLIRLAVALILFVVVLTAYWFCYSLVTAKSVEASQLEAQIQTQDSAKAQLAQAKSELASLATQEASINQYFIATSNVVPFLEELQSIGSYLGSTVQVVSVSASPGSPYGTLQVSLSISGSFDSVTRTIGALEYEPYNISITTLSLSNSAASGGASSSAQWNAAAQFTVGAQTNASSSTP